MKIISLFVGSGNRLVLAARRALLPFLAACGLLGSHVPALEGDPHRDAGDAGWSALGCSGNGKPARVTLAAAATRCWWKGGPSMAIAHPGPRHPAKPQNLRGESSSLPGELRGHECTR